MERQEGRREVPRNAIRGQKGGGTRSLAGRRRRREWREEGKEKNGGEMERQWR